MTEFADAIQDETIEPAPDSATTMPDLARETWEEAIEVKLTEEDQSEKRKRLESVDREIIRLEEEKKASAKVFTKQIKPLQAERDSILAALDSGTEKRMAEVYELAVPQLHKWEVRRVDNDDLVDERAMTEDEKAESAQGDLFASHGSSNPPPAAEDDDADGFEPSAAALAQAAEDEQRVVRTSSKEAKAKKRARANGAASKGSNAE